MQWEENNCRFGVEKGNTITVEASSFEYCNAADAVSLRKGRHVKKEFESLEFQRSLKVVSHEFLD